MQPDPLAVIREGQTIWIHYPPRTIVHDENSFWDMHNVKNNLLGLTEFEVIRAVDVVLDTCIPGPERRPVENGIDWVKDRWAQAPSCAPTRIIGGLFAAIGPEKISYSRQDEYFLPRLIYLTEWVQDTLGEFNHLAGYAAPWGDRFIPPVLADPPNRAANWAQKKLIGASIFVVQFIDHLADRGIDGIEIAAGETVRLVRWPFTR